MSGEGAVETDVEEIAPGVWGIRVPMQGHPLRASFCYAYRGEDGATAVIDPGWPTEHSWSELMAALRSIGSAPEQTTSILLTHAHRDHSGLAGRLAAVSGAPVFLHREDHALLAPKTEAHYSRVEGWLAEVGAARDTNGEATPLGAELPQLPEPITIGGYLEDGGAVPVPGGELIVHWTPGHTPGHLCFEDAARGLLFTGDHVLPRISPNISTMVGHRTSALGDYLHSLMKVRALAVEHVLPGHEYAFTGLGPRVAALLSHHYQRLQEILEILSRAPQQTTLEIARDLTWSRGWAQITGLQQRAALGEVLSHLHFLHTVGAVHRDSNNMPIIWSLSNLQALGSAWDRAGYYVLE